MLKCATSYLLNLCDLWLFMDTTVDIFPIVVSIVCKFLSVCPHGRSASGSRKGSELEWANQKTNHITGNIRYHNYNCWTNPMAGVPRNIL